MFWQHPRCKLDCHIDRCTGGPGISERRWTLVDEVYMGTFIVGATIEMASVRLIVSTTVSQWEEPLLWEEQLL